MFENEEARIRSAYARRTKDDFRYSWFNPGHLFFIQERERQVLSALKKCGFSSLKTTTILEIGCGTGYWLREFIKWGANPENITGIDLLQDRIDQARRLSPEVIKLSCGNGACLQFTDSSFDLVLQSTAFTSILDMKVKRQVASEMIRVLNPHGIILWYDYHANNPWNPDVRGIKKKELYSLFPRCRISLNRVTLAPPLARLLAPRLSLLASFLERSRLLCTHYIAVIRKA
jgi:SAM-dependent methyltransferase